MQHPNCSDYGSIKQAVYPGLSQNEVEVAGTSSPPRPSCAPSLDTSDSRTQRSISTPLFVVELLEVEQEDVGVDAGFGWFAGHRHPWQRNSPPSATAAIGL